WNGWKGQLLRELYFATEAALRGGRTGEHAVRSQLLDRAQAAREALAGHTVAASALAGIEDAYWIGFSAETQARHAAALAAAGSQPVVVAANIDTGRAATEIIVAAPDRPGLFADLCGALSASGANIVAAHLYERGEDGV